MLDAQPGADAAIADTGRADSGPPVSSCADHCPAVVAAGCNDGPPTVQDCESGCAEMAMSCPAEMAALLLCAGATATFQCDVNGRPYPAGCRAENASLLACRGGGEVNCTDHCPAVVAAGCNNGPPTVGECETGCANTAAQCPIQLAALLRCAGATPTFQCDANGRPYPAGCETENNLLNACL